MLRFPDRRREDGCLSDLSLDRLLANDLAESDDRAARAHLAECATCRGRHRDILEEQRLFQAAGPPLRVRPLRRRKMLLASAGAIAAVAAMCVLVVQVVPVAPTTRSKGSPSVSFFVKHDGAVRRGGPDEVVHPGDTLRFAVSSAKATYLTLLSVDGAGVVSVYFPDQDEPVRVAAGQQRPLPLSTILDATLGRELVIGAFCDAPVPPTTLRRLVERHGAEVRLPEGCQRAEISFEKSAR